MRFSVRVRAQNALFRRVRFSSPAQTWSHLTQRRILRRRSHVKAQSAPATSRKGALRATDRMQSAPFGEAHTQNALFRHVAAPGRCGATPRQAAGHYGECLNWANALEQPPAKLRGGLREGSQISAWSLASRKGALCPTSGLQNALFRESDTPRARLYVSRRLRSGALVHAVAPLRADVRTQECTQTGENGLSAQPPLACRECRVCPLVRPTRKMRFSVRGRT